MVQMEATDLHYKISEEVAELIALIGPMPENNDALSVKNLIDVF